MKEYEITDIIIREAIFVHRTLGPGLLEQVYKQCLVHRLIKSGLNVKKEVPIPVFFEEIKMECGYRADIIVENKVLIELKCDKALTDQHKAITLTYLKFANLNVGLLFNFHAFLLKNDIKRILNNYYPPAENEH